MTKTPNEKLDQYRARQISPLVGATITMMISAPADPEDDFDISSWGFQCKKGKRNFNVWIDMDDEGNGPGALSIEEAS